MGSASFKLFSRNGIMGAYVNDTIFFKNFNKTFYSLTTEEDNNNKRVYQFEIFAVDLGKPLVE